MTECTRPVLRAKVCTVPPLFRGNTVVWETYPPLHESYSTIQHLKSLTLKQLTHIIILTCPPFQGSGPAIANDTWQPNIVDKPLSKGCIVPPNVSSTLAIVYQYLTSPQSNCHLTFERPPVEVMLVPPNPDPSFSCSQPPFSLPIPSTSADLPLRVWQTPQQRKPHMLQADPCLSHCLPPITHWNVSWYHCYLFQTVAWW